jgi:hypothetical protein
MKGPNPVAWQHLAKFAISQGFQIQHAQALVAKEELYYSQLALEYLRKANLICSNFSSDHIQRVLIAVRSDESAKTCEPVLKLPYLSVDRRSSRPFKHNLTKEKEIIFFP